MRVFISHSGEGVNASFASARPSGHKADAVLFVDRRVAGWRLLAGGVPRRPRNFVSDIAADDMTRIAFSLRGALTAATAPVNTH